jgi:hypothetical protein
VDVVVVEKANFRLFEVTVAADGQLRFVGRM